MRTVLILNNYFYHIFDLAFDEVWRLVASDSWVRFKKTDEYQKISSQIHSSVSQKIAQSMLQRSRPSSKSPRFSKNKQSNHNNNQNNNQNNHQNNNQNNYTNMNYMVNPKNNGTNYSLGQVGLSRNIRLPPLSDSQIPPHMAFDSNEIAEGTIGSRLINYKINNNNVNMNSRQENINHGDENSTLPQLDFKHSSLTSDEDNNRDIPIDNDNDNENNVSPPVDSHPLVLNISTITNESSDNDDEEKDNKDNKENDRITLEKIPTFEMTGTMTNDGDESDSQEEKIEMGNKHSIVNIYNDLSPEPSPNAPSEANKQVDVNDACSRFDKSQIVADGLVILEPITDDENDANDDENVDENDDDDDDDGSHHTGYAD